MGTYLTLGLAHDVFVRGDTAYVAGDQGGVEILDVSNPTQPGLVVRLQTNQSAHTAIPIPQNNLMVVAEETACRIYNPTAYGDSILGNFFDSNVEEICLVGEGPDTFEVVVADLTDGFGTAQIGYFQQFIWGWWFIRGGFVTLPGSPHGVTFLGDTAYVAMGQLGLAAVDFSDFDHPSMVNWVDTPGSARKVAINANYAYVVCGRMGLQIIDVSNPDSLVIIGSCDTPGYAQDVAVGDGRVFIADGDRGLQVIDVSDPHNPIRVGNLDTSYAEGVFLTQNYVYLADRDQGLLIITWDN